MAGDGQAPFKLDEFTFDARPDTVDFRDRMYSPTLIEVPTRVELEAFEAFKVPVLLQGVEGACTGFGLATVANYLLRKRRVVPDETIVSPRMLYEMAKRYDEWPGENYQGSSARGAMKGWHKHGVCSETLWPYQPGVVDQALNRERSADAARRPLGAYYRVNHKDLVAIHSALAEVGVLFATAWTHQGWFRPDKRGMIPYEKDYKALGGHAFAIVAYDERGFWLQNSWGDGWGRGGFAQISYDDWLVNGLDIWAARLGVPVSLRVAESTAVTIAPGAGQAESYSNAELRPHLISLGADGKLMSEKTFGTSEADLANIFQEEIPSFMKSWDKKRLLLYAHGGLVKTPNLIQRVAEYRASFLKAEVYPLAFIWYTDFWSTVTNLLQEAFRLRRPEGSLSGDLDFMLDRLDDTLEPLVRRLGGKSRWEELKAQAYRATTETYGGARLTLKYLAEWAAGQTDAEIHLVAHSAGSIFFGPLVKLLATQGLIRSGLFRGTDGYGLPIVSCTLWAPAISIRDFKLTYLPSIRSGGIRRFTIYTLDDQSEQDDQCAQIYNRSLLYLISNAFEDQRAEPILGMEKFLRDDPDLTQLLKDRVIEWVRTPNNAAEGTRWASTARRHADFDDDPPTLRSTLSRFLNSWDTLPEFDIQRSQDSLREKRARLDTLTE
jgi:hypothetical protein